MFSVGIRLVVKDWKHFICGLCPHLGVVVVVLKAGPSAIFHNHASYDIISAFFVIQSSGGNFFTSKSTNINNHISVGKLRDVEDINFNVIFLGDYNL